MRFLGFILPALLALPLAFTSGQDQLPGVDPLTLKLTYPAAKKSAKLEWKLDARLYSPADASRAAAVDAEQLCKLVPHEELCNYRWLSIANVPANMRPLFHDTVSRLINELSREDEIVKPARVGPDGILLRINLRDYLLKQSTWDKMALASPYFVEDFQRRTVRITQKITKKKVEHIWPGGKDGNGIEFPKGYRYFLEEDHVEQTQRDATAPVKEILPASSLDPIAMAYLVKTLQTKAPLLRADWFIVNASAPPHYHDLLELKTLDDAKNLALFDRRTDNTEVRATVVISGELAQKVAFNNRILRRRRTANGAWWETQDFRTSTGASNVITNFLTNKRDGGEIIFDLPNGLHAYFLVNDKDERVDKVPDDIAKDYVGHRGVVTNGKTCFWCHRSGYQPFASDFKMQVNAEQLIDLGLDVKGDPYKTAELARTIKRAFENPDFADWVRKDNERYEQAIKKCMTDGKRGVAANASLFLQIHDDYLENHLNAERLVFETGVSDLDVQAAIRTKISVGDGDPLANSGVLLRRLMNPPMLIRRDQFEEVYPDFMRRIQAWEQVKKKAGN